MSGKRYPLPLFSRFSNQHSALKRRFNNLQKKQKIGEITRYNLRLIVKPRRFRFKSDTFSFVITQQFKQPVKILSLQAEEEEEEDKMWGNVRLLRLSKSTFPSGKIVKTPLHVPWISMQRNASATTTINNNNNNTRRKKKYIYTIKTARRKRRRRGKKNNNINSKKIIIDLPVY